MQSRNKPSGQLDGLLLALAVALVVSASTGTTQAERDRIVDDGLQWASKKLERHASVNRRRVLDNHHQRQHGLVHSVRVGFQGLVDLLLLFCLFNSAACPSPGSGRFLFGMLGGARGAASRCPPEWRKKPDGNAGDATEQNPNEVTLGSVSTALGCVEGIAVARVTSFALLDLLRRARDGEFCWIAGSPLEQTNK